MPPLAEFLLKIAPTIFELVAAGVIAVLHMSGADQHKTIAGNIAEGLDRAATVANAVNKALLNGAKPPDNSSGP